MSDLLDEGWVQGSLSSLLVQILKAFGESSNACNAGSDVNNADGNPNSNDLRGLTTRQAKSEQAEIYCDCSSSYRIYLYSEESAWSSLKWEPERIGTTELHPPYPA